MKQRQRGYTLIEILVVLFIISIVTTVALLTIGHNEKRDIETFAQEISQMISLAEEQAMLESHVLGLSVATQQLQFSSLQAASKTNKQQWSALDDHVLGTHRIPQNMQVVVDVGNTKTMETTSTAPQIVISSNGDITPFIIYVGKTGKKPLYAITGDADGHISTRLLS